MIKLIMNFLRSIAGKHLGLPRLLRPAILHLTVTDRCNLKCGMCNVWKEKPKRDIPPEVVEALVSSTHFRDFQVIEYGGGEPFLVDLPRLTGKLLHQDLKMILVTTNGWSTDEIINQVKSLLRLGDFSLIVNVSLDGRAAVHDRLRGIEGSYQRAVSTLKELAALKPGEPKLKVGAKLTILPANCEEIWPTYLIARELGLEFTAKPAAVFGSLHNEEMTFDFTPAQVTGIIETLRRIEEEQGKAGDFRNTNIFGRLYFFSNLIFNRIQLDYLRNILPGKEKRQVIPCFSSFFSVMVHVDGGVYCCPTLMKKVGTLPDEDFDKIWQGQKIRSIREFIHRGACSCYSQCDQMPSLVVTNKFRLGLEILKSYLPGG